MRRRRLALLAGAIVVIAAGLLAGMPTDGPTDPLLELGGYVAERPKRVR